MNKGINVNSGNNHDPDKLVFREIQVWIVENGRKVKLLGKFDGVIDLRSGHTAPKLPFRIEQSRLTLGTREFAESWKLVDRVPTSTNLGRTPQRVVAPYDIQLVHELWESKVIRRPKYCKEEYITIGLDAFDEASRDKGFLRKLRRGAVRPPGGTWWSRIVRFVRNRIGF